MLKFSFALVFLISTSAIASVNCRVNGQPSDGSHPSIGELITLNGDVDAKSDKLSNYPDWTYTVTQNKLANGNTHILVSLVKYNLYQKFLAQGQNEVELSVNDFQTNEAIFDLTCSVHKLQFQ